jgi:hypothetical protein
LKATRTVPGARRAELENQGGTGNTGISVKRSSTVAGFMG